MKLQLGAVEVITPLMSNPSEEAEAKIPLELKCPWVAEEERTRSVMRCPWEVEARILSGLALCLTSYRLGLQLQLAGPTMISP